MTSATPIAACSIDGAVVSGDSWRWRAGSNSSTLVRPWRLAQVNAASAWSISWRRSAADPGQADTPAENERGPGSPRPGRMSIDVASRRRATAAAASAVAPGSSRANSSPPVRKARSIGRMVAWTCRPKAASAWSPATCPPPSFTARKSSRSMRISPSDVWRVRVASTWRSRASWKARWLPSPVITSRSESPRASSYMSTSRPRDAESSCAGRST